VTIVGAAAIPAPASTCVIASSVSRETETPRATRARSASISSADPYRWSGSLASARVTTASRSCGMSGRSSDGGFGTCERCFIAISTGVSPVNGTWPVSIS